MLTMGDFKLVIPYPSFLAACLLLALVILMLLHVSASYFSSLVAVSDEKDGIKVNGEDVSERNFLRLMSLGKWAREWKGLPRLSLPISLSVVENETIGSGVGNGKG